MTDEKWHGTYDGYTNHGCRCDACRDANAQYNYDIRTVRAERILKDPSLAEHGNVSTYYNWGCRCVECRRANAIAKRRLHLRKKARAGGIS